MFQSRSPSRHQRNLRVALLLAFGVALLALLGALPHRGLAATPGQAQQGSTGKLAVVGAQSADFYAAPDGEKVRTLDPGATLTAVARTADNQWVLVYLEDQTPGWVQTNQLVIFGTEQLPVATDLEAAASATPAASPTVAATSATPASTSAATTGATAPAATATPLPTASPTPSPTLSPTPSPTPPPTNTSTPLPTDTPTPAPTPTDTPTNTPTPALVTGVKAAAIAVVGADGADLYDAPAGRVTGSLTVGAALSLQGRSGDGAWLYVQTTNSASGWVGAAKVVAFNVRELPVLGEGSAATAATAGPSETAPSTAAAMIEATTAPTATANAAAVGVMTATVALTPTATSPVTPTRRPTPVADGRPTARVAMSGSRLNVRAGPGLEYAIIGKALPDEVYVALARNGAATWVQVETPDMGDGFGWVDVRFVELSDPLLDLPISDETSSAPTAPTATPAPRATATGEAAPSAAASQPIVQRTAPTGLSGKLVIQPSPGGAFYLYDLASGSLRALAGGFDPALSPDGSEVAFTRIGDQNGIYLINTDGSGERQIFGDRRNLRSVKWSPDGKWLVFSRADGSYTCRDLGFGGLCVSEDQIFGKPPKPGPDATEDEVAKYNALRDLRAHVINNFDREKRPNWMIARVDANGGEYRDLPALNSAVAPDWSSAGIVYQSAAGLQKTVDKPDGETQPVINEHYYWDPDWQPGGGRIVFQAKQGPHWEIFSVNPDGSSLAALTRPKTTLVDQLPSNVAPAWSPDGQRIVFLSNREENGEAGKWRVWVMNADGSDQHPLPIDLPIEYTYTTEQALDWGM